MNKKQNAYVIAVTIALIVIIVFAMVYTHKNFSTKILALPKPQVNNPYPLNKALKERRSARSFQPKEVTTEKIAQLLWAADGVTDETTGFRTAPSPGALYPIDLYIVNENGIWVYNANKNALDLVKSGDLRHELADAAQNQAIIASAPIAVVLACQLDRLKFKYGDRSLQYCYMESGHISQNLMLEAVSLGLASVPIGSFAPQAVNKVVGLTANQNAIYIIPIGYKK